jgi:hypothetical protein
MPGPAVPDERIVSRTFVIAHLLTARIDLAESATLEAINAWKPGIETAEEIFKESTRAALWFSLRVSGRYCVKQRRGKQ